MIVKIQPPCGKISPTIAYNERKATGKEGVHEGEDLVEDILNNEKGHIVATRNVPDGSDLEEEIDRLRIKNMKQIRGRKLNNYIFHMSINPGEDDAPMTESELVSFVDELMERLGYSDVPYRIYKHTDIERAHYHVVASRIGQDGKKIPDSFENRNAMSISTELGKKYGFVIGRPENEKEAVFETLDTETHNLAPDEGTPQGGQINMQDEPEERKDTKFQPGGYKKLSYPPFDINSSVPVVKQYCNMHAETMQWAFTTIQQYKEIMRNRFNVEVEVTDHGITYAGLDAEGHRNTTPLDQATVGIDSLSEIERKCTSVNIKKHIRQKERLETVVLAASEEAKSWKDFSGRLKKKGINVILHKNVNDNIFGVTWLDRATRHAWKGSDTRIDSTWIKTLINEKGWHVEAKENARPVTGKGKSTTKRLTHSGAALKNRDNRESRIQDSINKIRSAYVNTPGNSTQDNQKDDIYEDETEKIMNPKII